MVEEKKITVIVTMMFFNTEIRHIFLLTHLY